MWWMDFPIKGDRIWFRCFARRCVGDFIALTIGRRGTSGLWILGRPYSRGGREFDGEILLIVASSKSEDFKSVQVRRSILVVGSDEIF